MTEWFNASPQLHWVLCPFTEAGFLRNATAPRPGQITMREAAAVLAKMTEHPGYQYLPITSNWPTLSAPFASRVYGTKQVTDAYLLGLAIQQSLILVTLDKALLHLAGKENGKCVLLLAE